MKLVEVIDAQIAFILHTFIEDKDIGESPIYKSTI